MISTFEHWTRNRSVQSLSTNWGAATLPFQAWRHFKEAFAPELVARAIRESRIPVHTCLDPFGGSGTTALACQFLGVTPTTIEVNPFLADLISAKLSRYDIESLMRDFMTVLRYSRRNRQRPEPLFEACPATFLEPGVDGRWLFDRAVAARIATLKNAIDTIGSTQNRRLFRVLLGGALVGVSNVITSGKGRRYRRNWQSRIIDGDGAERAFTDAVESAIAEIHQYSRRESMRHRVIRDDARTAVRSLRAHELVVFSPPYPNSFDYTDVYNIELWTLGYLSSKETNRKLRHSTLSSHVQISRQFADAPTSSKRLTRTLKMLDRARGDLWNPQIPEMVGAYFADMVRILDGLSHIVARRGSVWMVVGDSQYADVQIKVSAILADLAETNGWRVVEIEPFRSMRSSAQQGWRRNLTEDLVMLSKP
jgi:hypothetical protein